MRSIICDRNSPTLSYICQRQSATYAAQYRCSHAYLTRFPRFGHGANIRIANSTALSVSLGCLDPCFPHQHVQLGLIAFGPQPSMFDIREYVGEQIEGASSEDRKVCSGRCVIWTSCGIIPKQPILGLGGIVVIVAVDRVCYQR